MALIQIRDEAGQTFTSQIIKEDKENTDVLNLVFPNSQVIEVGDEVEYSDQDNTLIFSGIVQKVKVGTQKEAQVYDFGAQLLQRTVNQIFNGLKPEEIIEEVITNFTDLTYVSTITTTNTIPTYVSNKKRAWDVVTEMSELLLANFKVDQNKNFSLQLEGEDASAKAISSDNAILTGAWEEDISKMVNSVIVDGDERQIFNKTETFTGSFTQVTLTEVPIETNVIVSGVQLTGFVEGQSTGDYSIDRENKQLNFTSSRTNPTVEYTYSIPVSVRRRNKQSIDTYTQHDKTFKKPYIKTRDEARNQANFILSQFKDPLLSSTWTITSSADYKDFLLYEPNEVINVTDNIRSIFGNYIIRKVERSSGGQLKIKVGQPEDDFVSWSKESQQRIKQLEERDDNSTILNDDELVTEKLQVSFTTEITSMKTIGKGDAFIYDDVVNSQYDKTFKYDGGDEVILFP